MMRRSLMRRNTWDPVGNAQALRDAMGRLVEARLVRPMSAVALGQIFLPIDLYETQDDVMIEMAAPGYRPEDINISIEGDTVTVRGESLSSLESREKSYYRRERRAGSFRRAVRVPVAVKAEMAEASFDNGIIRLRLPKAEEAKPHRVPIRSAQDAGPVTRPVGARGRGAAGTEAEFPDEPNIHPTV
jgi:HSP20 family protein